MNKKQIGNFIGLVREYQLIKQESLALDVNISRPTLSKIENGIEDFDNELLNNIFSVLGIAHLDYEFNKEWIYKQLEIIFKSIVYGNQNYVAVLSNLKGKVEENIYLTFYPEYKLIMMIVAYKNGDFKRFEELVEECTNDKSLYDEYELAIYQDFLGLKIQDNNEVEKSLEIFNNISLFNMPDYLCGMVEYHKGISYHHMMNFYMSIKCFESAIHYFTVAQNFNKIIYTQMIISDAFFKTGNYNLAIETAEKSLEAAYAITNNEIIRLINSNLAWFALVKGDYEKTINHVQQALLYDSTKSACYFYLAFSYFRLCDTNKALHYIELAQENCNEDDLDYKMCLAVKKVIKNSKNQIEYLEGLYEVIDVKKTPVYKQLILEFIMNYYDSIGDYKNLAKYSIELNKLLGKKLLMFEH